MLLSDFEFIKGFPKSTGSRTDIWQIRQHSDNTQFALKLFVDTVDGTHHPPKSYPRLKHEIRVYKLLKKNLIDEENIRNILLIYAIGIVTFEDVIEFVYSSPFNTLNKAQIRHNLVQNTRYMLRETKKRTVINSTPQAFALTRDLKGYQIEDFTYAYMISQYVDGPDFGDLLSESMIQWNTEKVCKYLAVISTTLYQMASFGVNQNDLHMGNILMSNTIFGPTPYHSRVYLLVFHNKAFIVDNEYTPLIYDFDRAALYGQHIIDLESKKFGGNCPSFHEKRDFIRVLCALYHELAYVKIDNGSYHFLRNNILYKLVHSPVLRSAIRNEKGSCHLATPNNESSYQCDDELLDKGMVNPLEVVRFFFRHANFETFSTHKLINGNANEVRAVATHLFTRNSEKLQLNAIPEFIRANVQFVGHFSPKEKSSLLRNIANVVMT